ncbi:hypothetical protein [Parachlamydia sp. AcF125]|uniref:hypothetical protein n=1 Tax=Parachlamydia sp. AcF125 TaxID=2795736 RepID=UPI001BCA1609|nr:hypothetical protein [Parachlamydia sp. AcF125]MBS4168887.1 hypothetical protein [Parachlamydia sp. AcF125]
MFKVSHKTLIVIAGSMWIGIGVFLLQLGLGFLMEAVQSLLLQSEGTYPLMNQLSAVGEVKIAALALVVLSLLTGFFKGRVVLKKAVLRNLLRIKAFSDPTHLLNIYSRGNFLLIVAMIGLGVMMRVLGMPSDVRAFIDIAVGTALIQGGIYYLRSALPRMEQI